jgi:hypothetical protein
MKFEVLTEEKMSVFLFWVVTLCRLVCTVDTKVSEEHTASIFIPEDTVYPSL